MELPAFHPRLRLVGGDDPRDTAVPAPRLSIETIEREVVKENRVAAHAQDFSARSIDPHDPRWRLAQQTHARLQGAMLTPERRDELMATGRRLGLRPFESNLVIAVVQDQARRDSPLRLAEPTVGIIGITPTAKPISQTSDFVLRAVMVAVGLAIMLAGVIIHWLRAG